MPPRLNQVIAIEKGIKETTFKDLTAAHHKLGKAEPLSGITRTYRPKDEDGERLPGESKIPQVRAREVMDEAAGFLTRLFDITAQKDFANCSAIADVVLPDGQTLLKGVPATYLLFLEKQLVSIRTFVEKLPTLDPANTWSLDANSNFYVTAPEETTRTKPAYRNHVKYEATKEHPAQVEIFKEDVIVGYWTKVTISGAIPASDAKKYLDRVKVLQEAVKFAREQANLTLAHEQLVGKAVFGYLFAPTV